ncbi:hypothetical protein B0H14DRAFT_1660534 [Mycena olivaceomarginata]|nr:hypothetical protein B0H14DRAFT_1660534 [Mycena olivaceomarginata]
MFFDMFNLGVCGYSLIRRRTLGRRPPTPCSGLVLPCREPSIRYIRRCAQRVAVGDVILLVLVFIPMAEPWVHIPLVQFRLDDLIPGQIPSLTSLEISGAPTTFGWEAQAVLLNAFAAAPSLRQLWLSHASLESIRLPWIQLTHLNASGSLRECLKILNETQSLEVLDIAIESLNSAESSSSLNVTLPHLRIFGCSDGSEGNLLDHLTLPALRIIELSSLESQGVSRFLALGVRSAWSLRSIRLATMEYEEAILCLRSFSSLEEVDVEVWQSTDKLTPLAELLTNDNEFLPVLRSITIRAGGASTEPSASVLAEMLASRWHGNRAARLRSFHVYFFHLSSLRMTASIFEDLKTRVLVLVEEGLEVVIGIR